MEENLEQLLLIDLCGRLPYGVMLQVEDSEFPEKLLKVDCGYKYPCFTTKTWLICYLENVKPYLRPLSSITPEENNELNKMLTEAMLNAVDSGETGYTHKNIAHNHIAIDFFNKKMLDYRGLIPMGLALEAPEGMYKM